MREAVLDTNFKIKSKYVLPKYVRYFSYLNILNKIELLCLNDLLQTFLTYLYMNLYVVFAATC